MIDLNITFFFQLVNFLVTRCGISSDSGVTRCPVFSANRSSSPVRPTPS